MKWYAWVIIGVVAFLVFSYYKGKDMEKKELDLEIKSANTNKREYTRFTDLFHLNEWIKNMSGNTEYKKKVRQTKSSAGLIAWYMTGMTTDHKDSTQTETKRSVAREIKFLLDNEEHWNAYSKYVSELFGIIEINFDLLELHLFHYTTYNPGFTNIRYKIESWL